MQVPPLGARCAWCLAADWSRGELAEMPESFGALFHSRSGPAPARGGGVPGNCLDAILRYTTYPDLVLADTPLLYWRLGELQGSLAADASGNGRTGTYVGGPLLGQPGLLTGVDAAVFLTAVPSVQRADPAAALAFLGQAAYSVECWLSVIGDSLNFTDLLARYNGSSGTGWKLTCRRPSFDTTKLQVQLWRNTVNFPTTGAIAPVHLVGTYDGATLRLYRDGASVASAAATDNLVDAGLPVRVNENADPTFSAVVDEVAIYDYALSAAQVAAHRAAGLAVPFSIA